MKKTIFFTLFLCLLGSFGCAPLIYVSQDYDRHADFSKFKTFAWMPRPEKMPRSARAALESSPLLNKRIEDITGQILGDKGLTLSTANPDVLINFYVGFNDRIDISNWGYSYGPFWGYYWPGLGPMDVYSYKEGTLIMDFVDTKTKEMVWRGVAEEDLFTYDRVASISDKDLQRILSTMLAQYPPQRGMGQRH